MKPRESGFTLVEMAVSLAVVAIVMTLVMGVVIAQKSALQGSEFVRAMNDTGADAMVQIERHLRMAGFGVDPREAFDFSWFDCPTSELVSGPGGRKICRDRRDAADRLVFVSRNPDYRIDPLGTPGCTDVDGCPHGKAWRLGLTTASPPQLTLTAHLGDVFVRGQVLLSVCPSASRWTMSTVLDTATATSPGDLTLTLYPTDPTVPFFVNDFSNTCYQTGATVFQIDRYEYSIQTFNGVPWLMLDTGLDLDGDGSDPWTTQDPGDLLPIDPDIEDLQVAYVMNRQAGGTAPDPSGDWVTGDDKAAGDPPDEPDAAAPAPQYDTPIADATRQNLNPANIQAVRVSLVVRSEEPDPSQPNGALGDPLPLLENSTRVLTPAQQGGYRRLVFTTTVSIPNMDSRSMFAF